MKSYYSSQNRLNYFQAFIADIITARIVIFVFGFLLALGISFIFAYILQHEWIGYLLIYSCILVMLLVTIYLSYTANNKATTWSNQNPREHSANAIRGLRIFSIVSAGLAFLFACVCLYLRRSINMAIKTISLAAHAIGDMPLIIFSPIIQVIGATAFFVPFIFYCFFLASNGTFTNNYATIPGTSEEVVIGNLNELKQQR